MKKSELIKLAESVLKLKHPRSSTLFKKMESLGIGEKIIIPVTEQKHGYKSLMRAGAGEMSRNFNNERKFEFSKVFVLYPTKEEMIVGVEIYRTK
jgi:hypothetical protein